MSGAGEGPARTETFESRTGAGVVGRVEGREVAIGNDRLMRETWC